MRSQVSAVALLAAMLAASALPGCSEEQPEDGPFSSAPPPSVHPQEGPNHPNPSPDLKKYLEQPKAPAAAPTETPPKAVLKPPSDSLPKSQPTAPPVEAPHEDSGTSSSSDASSADSVSQSDGVRPSERQPVETASMSATAGDQAARRVQPASTVAGGVQLLVPEKTFRAEGRPRALRVSYDDIDLLRVLNMEPVPGDAVSHFPKWLSDLDGKVVRLRGFMYPAYEEQLSTFVLARDNEICCFGRNPKIYDLVGVKMRDGVTTRYIPNRPFDVVGTFHIRPVYRDGLWLQLYAITDASVIE